MIKSLGEVGQFLQLNNGLIKQIYQHVNFLANFRYKNAIEVLQSKHIGYEIEDFVQETVQEITKQFKTKKFPTINHLKSFINLVMEFHYLKEKRKYFYTKSRGPYTCVSLDDDVNDYRKVEDTISTSITTENFDLYNLLNKKLYLVYDWKTINIITKEELHEQNALVFSVNKFIELQIINGLKETCKIYKESGFHMTKTIFNQFSLAIINYIKQKDILVVEETEPKKYCSRPISTFVENKFTHLAKTCSCGYENKELNIHDSAWQCPNCGKIHEESSLLKFNLDLLPSHKLNTLDTKTLNIKEKVNLLLSSNV